MSVQPTEQGWKVETSTCKDLQGLTLKQPVLIRFNCIFCSKLFQRRRKKFVVKMENPEEVFTYVIVFLHSRFLYFLISATNSFSKLTVSPSSYSIGCWQDTNLWIFSCVVIRVSNIQGMCAARQKLATRNSLLEVCLHTKCHVCNVDTSSIKQV